MPDAGVAGSLMRDVRRQNYAYDCVQVLAGGREDHFSGKACSHQAGARKGRAGCLGAQVVSWNQEPPRRRVWRLRGADGLPCRARTRWGQDQSLEPLAVHARYGSTSTCARSRRLLIWNCRTKRVQRTPRLRCCFMLDASCAGSVIRDGSAER
jgi:hypothetical protein